MITHSSRRSEPRKEALSQKRGMFLTPFALLCYGTASFITASLNPQRAYGRVPEESSGCPLRSPTQGAVSDPRTAVVEKAGVRDDVIKLLISHDVDYFETTGSHVAGDGGEGLYRRVAVIPSHGYVVDESGAVFESIPLHGRLTSGAEGIVGGYSDGSETTKVRQFLNRATSGIALRFTHTPQPITISSSITVAMPPASCIDFRGTRFLYLDTTPSLSGAISAFNFSGVRYEVDDLTLDCVNQAQQYTGVAISRSSYVKIKRLHISNCRWSGLAVFDPYPGTTSHVAIIGGVYPLNRFGISANASNITISGVKGGYDWSTTFEARLAGGKWKPNSLYYDGIVLSGGDKISIADCDESRNGQSGIYVGAVSRLKVTGCEISGNFNKGIDVGPSPDHAVDVRLIGNHVTENHTGNISLHHVYGGEVTCNIVSDSFGGDGIDLQTGTENILISFNSVAAEGFKIFEESEVIPHATHNLITENVDAGGGGTWRYNDAESRHGQLLRAADGFLALKVCPPCCARPVTPR